MSETVDSPVIDAASLEAALIIHDPTRPQVVRVEGQVACEMSVSNDRYRMDGYSGVHSLSVACTDHHRLAAHWRMFRAANVERGKNLLHISRNAPPE